MDIPGERKGMDIPPRKQVEDDIGSSSGFLSTSCPVPRKWVNPKSKTSSKQQSSKPFIIGVCGGTASGKTSVCERIVELLANQRVGTLSVDSFYRPLTQEERSHVSDYNFDHPDAFDWQLIVSSVGKLAKGKTVDIPTYDFTTHSRKPDVTQTIHGSVLDIILIEGILLFHSPELRDMLDMKLFVDTDSDLRLARRGIRVAAISYQH